MYGIYANIWGILMVNVTVYSIHGSYGKEMCFSPGQSMKPNKKKRRLVKVASLSAVFSLADGCLWSAWNPGTRLENYKKAFFWLLFTGTTLQRDVQREEELKVVLVIHGSFWNAAFYKELNVWGAQGLCCNMNCEYRQSRASTGWCPRAWERAIEWPQIKSRS
jgi:hypothetical protein